MLLLELVELLNLLGALLFEDALQLPGLFELNKELVLLRFECNVVALEHLRLELVGRHVFLLLLLLELDLVKIVH